MDMSLSYVYGENIFFIYPQSRNKLLFPHIKGGEVKSEVLSLPGMAGGKAITYVDLTQMKGLKKVRVLSIPEQTRELILCPADFPNLEKIQVSEGNPYFSFQEISEAGEIVGEGKASTARMSEQSLLDREEADLTEREKDAKKPVIVARLLVSRDVHKLYYCFPRIGKEGRSQGQIQIPKSVKYVYHLAFQKLRGLSLSFLNPKVRIAQHTFDQTEFVKENQSSICFGNTLYRCTTNRTLFLDQKITKCSPDAFNECFPATIQAEVFPLNSFFRSMKGPRKPFRLEINSIRAGNINELPYKEIRWIQGLSDPKVIHISSGGSGVDDRLLCLQGVLFSQDGKRLIYYPRAKKGKSYYVPKGVERIEKAAFTENPFLTSVFFPRSILKIKSYAFKNCPNLRAITFEDGKIGETGYYLSSFCFKDCDELKNILLGNRVRHIGTSNIRYANTNTYYFPEGFEYLGCFNFQDCNEFYFPLSFHGIDSPYSLSNATFVSVYEGTAKGLMEAFYEGHSHHYKKLELRITLKNGHEVFFPMPTRLDGKVQNKLCEIWDKSFLDFQKLSALLPEIADPEERASMAKGILLGYKDSNIPKQVRKALRPFALQFCQDMMQKGEEESFSRFLRAGTLSREDMASLLEYCNQWHRPSYAAIVMEETRRRERWQQQNQFRL